MNPKTLILTLTAALLGACAPTTTTPKEIVIDGFKIQPGQHWVVEAKGGGGWSDRVDFVVSNKLANLGLASGYGYFNNGLGAVQYVPATQANQKPTDALYFTWKSTSDIPELKGDIASCVLREPKLAGTNPPRIEGRWILSITREENYLNTGDITGTGICTATLVQ